MKIVIIVPTYNEVQNIQPLVEQLEDVFARIAHDIHILVVDDNSPDGTAGVVRQLMQRFANVHLIEGQKAGLGAAYVRGMTHALEVLQADAVMEMDADFSHKPVDVPRMIAALDQGADFVIGSRYVRGGSIPAEWGMMRKLNSKVGNFVARNVAGIYGVRDCTAGFRAIRAALLKKISLKDLNVQGYAFQVALLFEAKLRGARIVELPVDFIDRTKGVSKLGLRDIVEFIIHAWWLRFRSSTTFIKFLIVGASGTIINLGVFTLLLWLGLNKFIASPIAIELSILSNFFWNNLWTFRWRKTSDSVQVRGLKYNAVSHLALGVSYGTFVGVSLLAPDLPPQVPQLAGIVPATFVNYFLNSYWTFRDRNE